jgi:ribonuclease HI
MLMDLFIPGSVARDSSEKFIAASIVYLPNVAPAAAAEAMAMREGLSLVNRLGCNNIQMESDSTETVEACSDTEPWWGRVVCYLCRLRGLSITSW